MSAVMVNLGSTLRDFLFLPGDDENTCRNNLVPSACKDEFYLRNSISGITQIVTWSVIRVFNWSGSCEKDAYYINMRNIQSIWHDAFKLLKEAHERYNELLKVCFHPGLDTYPGDKPEIGILEDWHYNVRLAFQESGGGCLEFQVAKIKNIFKNNLRSADFRPFADDALTLFQSVQTDFYSTRVRRLLGLEFPFAALQKVAKGEELDSVGQHSWEVFINKLCEACTRRDTTEKIGIRDLHYCMKALVLRMSLGDNNSTINNALVCLEWQLFKALLAKKCYVFFEKDPIYLRWVERQVIPSARIQCGSKTVQIDSEILGRDESQGNQHRVFRLRDDNSFVLTFSALNEVIAILEQKESEKNNEFPVAKIEEMDAMGFSLVEYVAEESVNSDSWMNSEARLDNFIKLIRKFHNCKHIPSKLEPSMMRFCDDDIKFVRFVPSSFFDWTVLVRFIRASVGDDGDAYIRIMKESGLLRDPVAKFYQTVLGMIVASEEDQLEDYYEQFQSESQKETVIRVARQMHAKIKEEAIFYVEEIASQYVLQESGLQTPKRFERRFREKIAEAIYKSYLIEPPFVIYSPRIMGEVAFDVRPLVKENLLKIQVSRSLENLKPEDVVEENILVIVNTICEGCIYDDEQREQVKKILEHQKKRFDLGEISSISVDLALL